MRHILPLSITLIVSAAILSAGIFLGLKNQTVVQVITPAPVERSPVATEERPATVAGLNSNPDVAVQARRLMEERRADLARTCNPEGKAVGLELRLIFDGKGGLASYAVNDPEDASQLQLAKCVREHRPDIKVESTGTFTTVQFVLAI